MATSEPHTTAAFVYPDVMAGQPKTTQSNANVDAFLAKLTPESKRSDARALVALFERVIGAPAKMWGSSIVGFGDRSYANASGKEIPWFVGGFAPRAQNFALYVASGMAASSRLLPKLGKHSTGKGCLYVRALSDVDPEILEAIVRATAGATRSGAVAKQTETASKVVAAKKVAVAKKTAAPKKVTARTAARPKKKRATTPKGRA